MHGRSLIRTIDIGVAGGIILLLILVSVFAWVARIADGQAQVNETVFIRSEFENAVERFRERVASETHSTQNWIDSNARDRAFLPDDAGKPVEMRSGSRATLIFASPADQERLRVASERLRLFNAAERKAEFVLAGPSGTESIALVTRWAQARESGLAVEIIDHLEVAARLERFGIQLRPPARVDAPIKADNSFQLISLVGDAVTTLQWNGHRVGVFVQRSVLPILMAIFAAGLLILSMLRHRWANARAEFMAELSDIRRQASTDVLTGLPNRRALFEFLADVPAELGRLPGSILMMDLDGFKWVNDTKGHQVGDDVIRKASALFSKVLAPGFVSRMGGDEFVAVMPEILTDARLQEIHKLLLTQLQGTIEPDPRHERIGVSIGAVLVPEEGVVGEELLRLADIALFFAKSRGRGLAISYDPTMKSEASLLRVMERELRDGIGRNEIILNHQPIVDAISGEVYGYESLSRWYHPTRGLISPNEFIPIAESSDLIIHLGNFVLDQALAELGPLPGVTISVNTTGRHLLSPNFVENVRSLLHKHQVEASRLCLEVTETSLLSDGEKVAAIMADLQQDGIRFAIDDFGAGYASLGYLLKFKFDILKIDRDFIAALDDKPESSMIVMSVVSLARSLGMRVVGEGVETGAQHRFLASAGCAGLQGYLFGRPAPIAQVLENRNISGSQKADLISVAAA